MLGKEIVRPTSGHDELINELIGIGKEMKANEFDIVRGKTLCASDFYEGAVKSFIRLV